MKVKYLRCEAVHFIDQIELKTIYDNYYDNKTTTVFVTNLLFLVGKLVDVYGLANTKTNIFYSAYLKDKVQYNYADPDKVKEEHRVVELTDVAEPKESA